MQENQNDKQVESESSTHSNLVEEFKDVRFDVELNYQSTLKLIYSDKTVKDFESMITKKELQKIIQNQVENKRPLSPSTKPKNLQMKKQQTNQQSRIHTETLENIDEQQSQSNQSQANVSQEPKQVNTLNVTTQSSILNNPDIQAKFEYLVDPDSPDPPSSDAKMQPKFIITKLDSGNESSSSKEGSLIESGNSPKRLRPLTDRAHQPKEDQSGPKSSKSGMDHLSHGNNGTDQAMLSFDKPKEGKRMSVNKVEGSLLLDRQLDSSSLGLTEQAHERALSARGGNSKLQQQSDLSSNDLSIQTKKQDFSTFKHQQTVKPYHMDSISFSRVSPSIEDRASRLQTTQAINDFVQQKLQKNMRQLQKAHYIDLKNQRAICMQESLEFVKESSKKINHLLSKHHQKLVRQVIDYRSKTMTRLAQAEKYHSRMQVAEEIMAIRNPILIYEAEYQINKESFCDKNLYSSYLPRLKQYLRSKTLLLNQKHMQANAQHELAMKEILEQECVALRERN